jgi:hypothetical protein
MDYAQRMAVKPGKAAPFTIVEREMSDGAE